LTGREEFEILDGFPAGESKRRSSRTEVVKKEQSYKLVNKESYE